MTFENSLDFARQLDNNDPFHKFRSEFKIPKHSGKDAIYFLGNSLGLQPKITFSYITDVLQQWENFGVEGFFKGQYPWLHYHDLLRKPLGKIVGALPEEIVVMNSLTVNLHLLLVSFYEPSGKRNKILCEAKAFCSDQYMLESHVKQRGLNPDEVIIEVHPREGETTLNEKDILAAIEQHADELLLVFFGGVNYYTGQVLPIEKITTAAHKAGAIAGFDLAHAAGNIHLELHDWNVDFASWCSYKYLNSGPGAIAGNYIHERFHDDQFLNRFAGWWGYKKDDRFKMHKGFVPINTAEGWQLSTPSALLYASHKAALDLFDEAGMANLEKKGQQLSDYLLFLLNDVSASGMIRVLTPPKIKGCQVSIHMLERGREVFDQLTNEGVFADWREPDVIRVAPVPLYNTFEEVWQFNSILQNAINNTQ
ncbi:MAG TPA: kynureninase [Flavisolibacter sp.]|nr:kynureninase [Flavisolibacter sp.]